jgi:hypothetical protein
MKGNNMAYPKTILIGDRVRYESAAGTIRGEVIDIVDRVCADGVVRPWICVKHNLYFSDSVTWLPDSALEIMKFKVIFRDIAIQKEVAL